MRRQSLIPFVCTWLVLASSSAYGQNSEPLTLERAVMLAATRNERAAVATARIAAADATVRRARAFFFPDVTVGGTYTRRAYETVRRIGDEDVTIQNFDALNGTVNLFQPLFDARAIPLYRRAKLERDSIRLDAAEDRRILMFEAADAFVVTLSLEQVALAAARRRDLARSTHEDARARFEAGLVSSNDVTKAELELATAEREVSTTSGDARTAYLELGNLLNTEVRGPLVPPAGLLEAATDSLPQVDQLVRDARERRLDIAAQELHAQALRVFATEPSKRIIPSVGLNGQYRATNEGGLSGRDQDGSMAVNILWNPFDGGERSADRAERRALARAAELETELATREVELDVRSAIVGIESQQASTRQAEAAVDAARRNARETSVLYRQGLARAIEVADANARLFEAEVAEARARYQIALALLDLRSAVGLDPLGQEIRNASR